MSTEEIILKQKRRTAWKFDRGQWEEIDDSEMEHYLRQEKNRFPQALLAAGYEILGSVLLGDEDGAFYAHVHYPHGHGKEPRYRYCIIVCTGGSYLIETIYVVDFPSLLTLLNELADPIRLSMISKEHINEHISTPYREC